MSETPKQPKMRTSIATSDATSITIRDQDLVDDLIGKVGFTEMIYRHLAGRYPAPGQARVLDACLVTLMEHGITPSSLIARLMIDSTPDQLQVAVSSGLNAVGNVFVGTMEGCGVILQAASKSDDPAAYLDRAIAEHRDSRTPLPGFGHPFHKPDDPRTPRLLELVYEVGLSGRYCDLLRQMNRQVDAAFGKHLTINATGATAALLLEAGLQPDIFRGIAVISRSAGLVTHIQEERRHPTARRIWQLVEEHTEFVPE